MKNLRNWNYSFGARNMRQRRGWQRSITILLLSMGCSLSAKSQTTPTDKLLHLSAGYVISSGTTAILHNKGVKNPELWGIAAGFAAGIIKELIDDRPDPVDAYATMVGSVVGAAIITIPINGKSRHSKRGDQK